MAHGGDVYTNGLLKGIELIDFSSNINPLGVPNSFADRIAQDVKVVERYPDLQYREVLENLRKYTGIEEKYFVLGNGAAEIIDLVISCFKNIVIVVPSFEEYEISAKKWNCNIEYSYLKENMEIDYTDLIYKVKRNDALILGNPNNPNGGLIDQEQFNEILSICEETEKTVIIDEAFIEFTDNEMDSFISKVTQYKSIFIIRALTKFFAMPGIRFGYGITSNKNLLTTIKGKQNPWNINCFAELATRYVLEDEEYINESKKLMKKERKHFLEQLNKIDFIDTIYPTSCNYVLCKLKIHNDILYQHCLENKILIRKAHDYKGLDEKYVRFAIKDRKDNNRFLDVLNKGYTVKLKKQEF